MKFFIVIVLIAVVVCYIESNDVTVQNRVRFSANAVFHQLFELLRDVIKNGDPEKDISRTDPYKFAYAEFNLPAQLFSIQANITRGTINGLGDYEVLKTEFSKEEIVLDLDINFPLVNLEAEHYEMKGRLLHDVLPISGVGRLQFTIHNFNFYSKVYLKQSEDEKAILIDRFENPHFSIETITSRTQYDGNFDDIFNSMIEDLLADYLTRFNGYLTATYSGHIIDLLNRYFTQFDSWRIITVIL